MLKRYNVTFMFYSEMGQNFKTGSLASYWSELRHVTGRTAKYCKLTSRAKTCLLDVALPPAIRCYGNGFITLVQNNQKFKLTEFGIYKL